ncbi:hypothetical protein SDC9_193217 [bioreactor metagenome]|uniref:Uncharacterized protein n=1 Tax=bioreactor metagenome TaxID=1076179 RepID=A0A645I324_9ZZZZ
MVNLGKIVLFYREDKTIVEASLQSSVTQQACCRMRARIHQIPVNKKALKKGSGSSKRCRIKSKQCYFKDFELKNRGALQSEMQQSQRFVK